jgi:hypothetical protein
MAVRTKAQEQGAERAADAGPAELESINPATGERIGSDPTI